MQYKKKKKKKKKYIYEKRKIKKTYSGWQRG